MIDRKTQWFDRFGQNSPHHRIGEQRPDLVLDRRDGVGAVAEGVFFEFFSPEELNRFVRDLGRHGAPELLVGEQARHVQQRGVAILDERVERVAKDMLHTHAPGVGPVFLEGLHQSGRRQSDHSRMDPFERIVPERLSWIWRV